MITIDGGTGTILHNGVKFNKESEKMMDQWRIANDNTKNLHPLKAIGSGGNINNDIVMAQSPQGFNSGMEARELYQPKTVDDLRVESNPKNTYGGVVLGAKSDVQHRGIMGKMEKNRPDTFYESGPERYFTTNGAFLRQSAPEVFQLIDRGKKRRVFN